MLTACIQRAKIARLESADKKGIAMRTYLVTRHAGAVEWLKHRLGVPEVLVLPHLENIHFQAGDKVCGVLPLSWAERICAQGAEAHVVSVEVPPMLRGQEMSATQLDALGARLVRYDVRELSRL